MLYCKLKITSEKTLNYIKTYNWTEDQKFEKQSDGSTIMNTMQQVIGALATALATGCLAWGSSSISGSEAIRFTNGFHYGIYFAIILIVVALLLSFKIKDQKN